MKYGEAEYLRDNYGSCKMQEHCVCLKPENTWLGTGCPNWEPTTARTLDELVALMKGLYK